jgi:putative aldouronate transport system substrate-binding protein
MNIGTLKFIAAIGLPAIILIAGCSNNNTETASSAATQKTENDSTKSAKPLEISIAPLLFNGTPPDPANSPFYKELQKRTNTKLTIEFIESSGYPEKMNLALASKKLKDVTVVKNFTDPNIYNAVNQGAFTDLTPYLGDLKKYPNLAKIPEHAWNDIKINGKIFGIPNTTGIIGNGFYIRKDWLEQLKLPVPQTVDEFTNVLKQFKTHFPDKSPAIANGTAPLAQIGSAFGTDAPVFAGDQLLLKEMTTGYREYLLYMRSLYQDGLIPKEYSVIKNAKELFWQGRGGALNWSFHEAWLVQTELAKSDPKAEFMIIPPLKGPGGYATYARDSFYGAFAIPSSVSKEKVLQVLDYLDRSASEEINDLRLYGLEGIHHKVVDGKKVVDNDALNRDVGGTVYVIVNTYRKYNEIDKFAAMPEDYKNYLHQKTDEHYAKVIPDAFYGLVSETYSKRSADVLKDMSTLMAKVIVGQSPIGEWDTYIGQLKNDPTVQQMMKEYGEQYRMRNKK